jgi:hypothetical protein
MRKLSDAGIRRTSLVLPLPLLRRIETWRRKEPDLPVPSEAIRRLIVLGLENKGARVGPSPSVTPPRRHA